MIFFFSSEVLKYLKANAQSIIYYRSSNIF